MKRIQESNAANHTKQRLSGSEDARIQSAKVLAKNLSTTRQFPIEKSIYLSNQLLQSSITSA